MDIYKVLNENKVVLGCMRLAHKSVKEAELIIQNAIDLGVNFFDHADIYGDGESELIFAQAFNNLNLKREDIILQSKIGIRKEFAIYDQDYDYIIKATDDILKRLDTDYLDILLIHRPDVFMDPKQVAKAMHDLRNDGKVKHFGVSNFNPHQIELIKHFSNEEILINQIQLSITHSLIFDEGINVNLSRDAAIVRTQGLLEYAWMNNLQLQAWSPFQFGFIEGSFLDNEDYPEINLELETIAKKYNVSKTAIATSWITSHPIGIQIVAGTMTPSRLSDVVAGSKINLTKKEWYDLYKASGKTLP